MNRRTFLQTTACAGVAYCAPLLGSEQQKESHTNYFALAFAFDLSLHVNMPAKLWVPMPQTMQDFQKIITSHADTDASKHLYTKHNHYEAPTYFAAWDKTAKSKKLTISITLALQDRVCDFKPKNICKEAQEAAREFLKATPHLPTDGVVRIAAKNIVGNEQEPLKKARKIYDWIVANSYRDESVLGCGVGSPNAMLAQLEKDGRMGGKCLDMSALCVALMRASGIPAREVMGIRAGASRFSHAFGTQEDITKAQHCKLEFFIDTLGWVPCDPADITKLILKEGLTHDAVRTKMLSEQFFGFWENNWIALNHARDFALYPKNTQGELDSFGYVYGEADDEYIDPFEPKKYIYTLSAKRVVL